MLNKELNKINLNATIGSDITSTFLIAVKTVAYIIGNRPLKPITS